MATGNHIDALSGALLASKSILARLLATENIAVEHQPVATASFDVENRVLTLPMWERMSNELYDMLVGHEVAHALFTPEGGDALLAAVDAVDRGNGRKAQAKDCLNIIEDARIERLMKDRFPGLIRDFDRGYREMHADGIFDLDGVDVAQMGLADRINLHFKLGHIVDVPFSSDEQAFVDAIADAESFDDVIELSKQLFDLTDGERESEEQEEAGKPSAGAGNGDADAEQQANGGDEAESGDSDDSGSSQGTGEGDDGSTESQTSNGTDFSPEGDKQDGVAGGPEGSDADSPIRTAGALDRMAEEHADITNRNRRYVRVPDLEYDRIIVPATEIAKDFDDSTWRPYTGETSAILSDVNRIASNMAKRFEMKQAAKVARRAQIAKTGVLDTVRMMSYKYSDDIFRRNTILPKGKNHGMIMFIDWSGSMHEIMSETLVQAMNMAAFCRKIGIPFAVYGFTSIVRHNDGGGWMTPGGCYNVKHHRTRDYAAVPSNFQLLELVSSSQRMGDFRQGMLNLSRMVLSFRSGMRSHGNKHWPSLDRKLQLGGTPLNDTILAAKGLADRMRRTGVEILNLVFLTDGASNSGPLEYVLEADESLRLDYNAEPVLLDSHKRPHRGVTRTENLLKWLRADTGARTVGFYLTDRIYTNAKTEEFFKANKYAHLGALNGYEDYFVLNPKTGNRNADAFDRLDDDASARKTATAFIKQAAAKAASKNLMSQFAEIVAQTS